MHANGDPHDDAQGGIQPLPVVRVGDVPDDVNESRWLVEGLWLLEGVGVVGGAPKSCKTWLALELAVATASGTPALGRFAVAAPGPVLLYCAEDATVQLRERVTAIAATRSVAASELDIGLIVVPSLRLDLEEHRARLRRTLEIHQPRLLVLDPLVRLHRADENSANNMAALLGELRALQRDHHVAVALIHHFRKNGAAIGQDGQALRGSGDLHAWGDSNLYLRRRDRQIVLTAEHRAAPASGPFALELVGAPVPALRFAEEKESAPASPPLLDAVRGLLASALEPMKRSALRAALRVRNETLGEALDDLTAAGKLEQSHGGLLLRAASRATDGVPVPATKGRNGTEPRTTRRDADQGLGKVLTLRPKTSCADAASSRPPPPDVDRASPPENTNLNDAILGALDQLDVAQAPIGEDDNAR